MTKKLPIGHRIKDLLLMILAILLYSLGVSLFYGPSGLTPGGLSGLAIVLDRLDFLPFGKGLIILIFNLPILLLGVWRFGFKFLSKTIVAVAASSLLMELLDGILNGFSIPYTIGALPAAIGGGVLVGVSIGMIMRAGCTFGGTDIIIKILRQKYKHMQTGTFYLILDGVIVLFGSVCAAFGEKGFSPESFNMELLIYSILAIFIQSYFSNFVLYGSDGARMLYIITEKESLNRHLKNLRKELPGMTIWYYHIDKDGNVVDDWEDAACEEGMEGFDDYGEFATVCEIYGRGE
jgi:uncharacterized membrane-anchored protein YitT (DUF2179 family)